MKVLSLELAIRYTTLTARGRSGGSNGYSVADCKSKVPDWQDALEERGGSKLSLATGDGVVCIISSKSFAKCVHGIPTNSG